MRKPGINMTVGALLLVVSFGISAAALYGGAQLVKRDEVASAEAGGGGGGATGGPVSLTVVAETLQFDTSTITASAGVEVTVMLDNRDAGVLHNISFYTNRSATSVIYEGELFAGPATQTEVFSAPATPGTYFFKCDAHTEMNGNFNVQ